jgi:hypothetical protein
MVFLSLPAAGDVITYQVFVDTSSQNGNYGYIDLELNATTLGAAGPVTASVFNFSGGTLNPSDTNNDELGTASGSLPDLLNIDNSGFNDYFEGLTFGSQVTFDVTLSGSGVDLANNADNTADTEFQVFFFDSTTVNPLFTSDPTTGAADLIDISPTGVPSTVGNVSAVPEPGSFLLILSALVAAGFGTIRRISRFKPTFSRE